MHDVMPDVDLFESVAQATGESIFEITRRGFHDAAPVAVCHDPEPWGGDTDRSLLEQIDLRECGIDWDDSDFRCRSEPRHSFAIPRNPR